MIQIRGTVGAELKKQFEKNVPLAPLEKKIILNDSAALAAFARKKRIASNLDKKHEKNDEERMIITGKKDLNEFIEKEKEEITKREVKPLVEKSNLLARQYGLEEPNHPDALKFDRLHCYTCGMKLHVPNAYRELPEETQLLFGRDEDVRTLCCFCFAKMEENEIIDIKKGEATKEIRMMIYNPEAVVEGKVEQLTKERRMYIESKIKRYNGISLIGTFKYNSIEGEDMVVNNWLSKFPTRYDYANN
jgi:hypothetical protein